MSSDDPHNRLRHKQKSEDDDDEEDLVDKMLKKAGCAEQHYKVQECMADTKDWRQCQHLVKDFKTCIEKSRKNNS